MKRAGRLLSKLLISAALFLGLQEAALRLVFPLPEVRGFNRALYMNAPGQAHQEHGIRSMDLVWESQPDGARFPMGLNAYGFRGAAPRVAPDPDRTRVLFVGDSFVEGVMAADDETLPQGFARAAERADHSVEAVNLGISGISLHEYVQLVPDATALFQPQAVVLVLFANDFLGYPPGHQAREFEPWPRTKPRALDLLALVRSGEPLPMRWSVKEHAFHSPAPSPGNFWSGKEDELRAQAQPEIAQAILDGRFNPFRVGGARCLEEPLRQPPNVQPTIADLAGKVRERGASLYVAYVPDRSLVTDHYQRFEATMSAPDAEPYDFEAPRYQVQRRALARSCERAGVPFLDLTPVIKAEEDAGNHLYWDYDDHLRGEGYLLCGQAIHDLWSEAS